MFFCSCARCRSGVVDFWVPPDTSSIHVCEIAYMYMQIHIHMSVYTHIYIHVYTYAHTYMHTYVYHMSTHI